MNVTGKQIANFLLNDFRGMLNKRKISWENNPIPPERIRMWVWMMATGWADKKEVRELAEKALDEYGKT